MHVVMTAGVQKKIVLRLRLTAWERGVEAPVNRESDRGVNQTKPTLTYRPFPLCRSDPPNVVILTGNNVTVN